MDLIGYQVLYTMELKNGAVVVFAEGFFYDDYPTKSACHDAAKMVAEKRAEFADQVSIELAYSEISRPHDVAVIIPKNPDVSTPEITDEFVRQSQRYTHLMNISEKNTTVVDLKAVDLKATLD